MCSPVAHNHVLYRGQKTVFPGLVVCATHVVGDVSQRVSLWLWSQGQNGAVWT